MKLSGLEGRTAIVTGASRGIGRSIAKVMAGFGARVVCSGRNRELLAETCSEIERDGGKALSAAGDITSVEDRNRLIDQAVSAFEGIDILVNNAGVHTEAETLDLSDEAFKELMDVNLFSMFSLSRDVARQMISRGGGKIVNIGSHWGRLGVRKNLAYCVSKAAVEALTRCLAVDWAQYNIQVTTVAPGHTRTDISRAAMEDERIRKSILRRIPARRIGEPEEVGYLVAFLCSQEANYLTGHTYAVDGGQQIAW